ncbi:MAG TPA: bifunctional chorismate mutase/prephenate dehydrogenase [Gemmatimonadaceae bacterium]|nr:bifunctional chorismate mutase/prephenate dehydrogenase [Gemmatimonadaceae bacterium]
MSDFDLTALRERIRQIDAELVALAGERISIARAVGEAKREQNLPTTDYRQERVVLDRARAASERHGLDPKVAEVLIATLIRASVSAQDRDNQRSAALGAGQRAVVIGGAGRMGQWLIRFLADQGYTAGSLDPASPAEEQEWARETLPTADLIVCSTPPVATAALYEQWAANPPGGVVVDIASIKTPLLGAIEKLMTAGGHVASIHPMFGPSVVLLRDCDVVICDTGDAEATATVERLFQPTTAHVIHLPLADHDRIMADVLSLAHATAIAFAVALPDIRHSIRSTTLSAMESLAYNIVRESPDVYYEIQAENPYSMTALARMRAALDRVVNAVEARDPERFRALLAEGKRRTERTGS